MLIVTTITSQPEDFQLLAQNMITYEICGYTEQEGFTEVNDIPVGFNQRVLPGHYGDYLTLAEITNFTLIENGQLKQTLNNTDLALIEQYEIQCSQDASILELYELIGGK